jgi:hypothetical protein
MKESLSITLLKDCLLMCVIIFGILSIGYFIRSATDSNIEEVILPINKID